MNTGERKLWISKNGWHYIADFNGRIMVANEKICWCDWPTLYDDGRFGWEFPTRIPKYVREVAKSILKERKKNG